MKTFLRNKTTEDKHFKVTGDVNTLFVNSGIPGAIVVSEDGQDIEVCLAPDTPVTVEIGRQTGEVEVTGRIGLEINGVMLPYAIDADHLGDFIAGDFNPSLGGIVFETIQTPLTFKVGSPDAATNLAIYGDDFTDGTTIEVDWGDGTSVETFNKGDAVSHDYPVGTEGIATFKFNQPVPTVQFLGDAVTEVVDFGSVPITNPRFRLYELVKVPTTLPRYVTDMSYMFNNCHLLNDPNISNWDTSEVTAMNSLFVETTFNQPLNNWDVSNVTNMRDCFDGCSEFNQPLNTWNTSKVTDMSGMFELCSKFNQSLSNFDTSNVTTFGTMFRMAENFNQDISNWNVSKGTDFNGMFEGCGSFNSPLNSWSMGNAVTVSNMFSHCSLFDQPLSDWDVSNVTDMTGMLYNTSAFNQDLSSWCVTLITEVPEGFNDGGKLTPEQLPVWGTCPVAP